MRNKKFIVGEWSVAPTTNILTKDGRTVALAPRLIDLLVYFAEHPSEVISRNTIIESVWDRSFVTDQAVTQSIFELRKCLRDGRASKAVPEYIQTIPKRGYRLVAEVRLQTEHTEHSPHTDTIVSAQDETSSSPSHPSNTTELVSSDASPTSEEKNDNTVTTGFSSKVAEFARNFWLNESTLGFKKTRY